AATSSMEPAATADPAEESSSIADSAENAQAPPAMLAPEVGQAARAALEANWNDWAAHRNLAAFLSQEGEFNLAIAHATAAFAQHPASPDVREVLLAAYGETPLVDANLRRMLGGAWYQRVPALLSASGWQKLALAAALIVAA